MRERIKEAPCQEVIKYVFRPGLAFDIRENYQYTLAANKAHVLMLAEEGIIEKETAQKIISVNLDIADMQDDPKFNIDYNKEDLYFIMEQYLIEQTNLTIGGQQHTARSRNDLKAAIQRMSVRNYFFKLSQLFIEMRETLIDAAYKNLDSVMSGYTHMQPSEPTTLAAYLSGILGALERDYGRLANVYPSLNINPLGACAMASTSFPINRKSTAAYLGFDDTVANSIDCVASRDYALETLNALAMASITISRMAQDMYIWATPEFNYIEVGGSVATCSSIMPQKKNCMTLEHMKAKAAHLEGAYVSMYTAMKNAPFTHCRDIKGESMQYLWTAFHEAEAQMSLTIPTIKTLKVNRDIMLEKAEKNFCAVTELANYLVTHDHISFREAHEIVGALVAEMITNKKNALDINHDLVEDTSQRLFNHGTTLTNEQIFKALDPAQNVAAKCHEGGSAPVEVKRQLARIEEVLRKDKELLKQREEKVENAALNMDAVIKEFLEDNR